MFWFIVGVTRTAYYGMPWGGPFVGELVLVHLGESARKRPARGLFRYVPWLMTHISFLYIGTYPRVGTLEQVHVNSI